MKDVNEPARKTAQEASAAAPSEQTQLDRRYGDIGISAVAAAVRYQGAAKNPAYAPVPTRWEERDDVAA